MTDRDDRQNRPDSLADAALDALFAEARAERNTRDTGDLPDLPPGGAEGLPPGLSARILADADTLMDLRASTAEAARAAARAHVPARGFAPGLVPAGAGGMGGAMMPGAGFGPGGFWAQVIRAIGGGAALAGLGAVTLVGLWLGLMPPAALQSGLDSAFGTGLSANPYLVDSTSAFEFLDSEG
ncbi:hypothetical protein [Pseudooceanicola marinus]|uniref:hypothetical protein n=1 Tax=Pseudooceanicola marinus TaxID=396013 RepID=UPI001CD2CC38|nr:hypothetical protein [Pseudooceanicola marinus]MCA1337030.1 hypothetical protein [Pseudooceanicola marinus]